ncbi:hypothetical protein MMC25_007898 [Agyrium rufum]|nr:hypothetical protein [Agyrium rufum]
MLLPLLLLLFLEPFVSAVDIYLSIPPSTLLPSPSILPQSTKAYLTAYNLTLSAPLRRTNDFVFRNVPQASYLCEVYALDYAFMPVRLDIGYAEKVEAWQTFRGNEWDNRGEALAVTPVENGKAMKIDMRVVGPKEYYEARSGLDPELKKEMEEQQAKGGLASGMAGGNPLEGFDMAGWMAGQTAKTSSSEGGGGSGGGSSGSKKRRG